MSPSLEDNYAAGGFGVRLAPGRRPALLIVDFVRAYPKLGSRIRNICLNGNFSITNLGAADGRGGHRDPWEHHGVHPQTQRA